MGNIQRPFFKHYVFEATCGFDEANSVEWLEEKIFAFLKELDIVVLQKAYHQFRPQGISLVYILSASHIAIHTWPEEGYIQVDLISCQKGIDLQKVTSAVERSLVTFEHKVYELDY